VDVAVAILHALAQWYRPWVRAGGDPIECGLWEAYRGHCATLGRAVTALLPGGATVRGMATDIDPDGRLVVATTTGEQRLSAGDVHHLRSGQRPLPPDFGKLREPNIGHFRRFA
jgi:BirA family biotin operon repressor/biotin-[acetyl-CoA-carboxylase] ligase